MLPAISITTWLRAGAAVAVLLAAWWALDTYGDGREAEGRAAVQAEWDAQRQVQEAAAREADARYRALSDQFEATKQEALHAREIERAASARTLAAVHADHDRRLRDAITSYASGGGLAAPDTAAACRGRAARLGAALDEALSAHGECTATAVDLAADLRAVLAAWPVAAPAGPGQAPTTTERTDHVPDL